jgi:hypothetical protein
VITPRPLIVCDCDEVLLHMVVPFRTWLDEEHGIFFDFASPFEEALRHKHSGSAVGRTLLWELLGGFFQTEMHRQTPIVGALEAMHALRARADLIIVTNIGEEQAAARAAQLRAVGLDAPVIGNRGGKGPIVTQLMADRAGSLTIFVDDLENNHSSVAAHAPQAWRLQLVGEPEIAPHAPTAADAHIRIDDWATALTWIEARLDEQDAAAPATTRSNR